jgi:hypothetical protein
LSSAAYATDNTCFLMICGHHTLPSRQREQVEGEEAAGWVHEQAAGMDGVMQHSSAMIGNASHSIHDFWIGKQGVTG